MSRAEDRTSRRVLVVDDHRMFADSVVRLLNDEPDLEVVGLVSTIADAVRDARSTLPDIVLLDFQLPDGEAPECVARLNEVTPDTRILIMTGLDDHTTMRAARDAGCLAVAKNRAATDLIPALRALFASRLSVGLTTQSF